MSALAVGMSRFVFIIVAHRHIVNSIYAAEFCICQGELALMHLERAMARTTNIHARKLGTL